MIDAPISNNQVVTVIVVQTTFAILKIPGKQFRVDFVDKAEAQLKPGMRGKFISFSEHPLLMKYNGPLVSVYLNSRPQDPQGLLEEIQQRIQTQLQGWRNWLSVTLGAKALQLILRDGNGMLLQAAPASIAHDVIEACNEQGVSTWVDTAKSLAEKPVFHLLLIGDGYVIARGFRFTEVLTKTAPPASQLP